MPIYINKHGKARYIIHGVYFDKAEFEAIEKLAKHHQPRISVQAYISMVMQQHVQSKLIPINTEVTNGKS